MNPANKLLLSTTLLLTAAGCSAFEPAELQADPASASSIAQAAQIASVLDADVFNWRFYVNSYGDLLMAGIDTPAEAQAHWQNRGIRECRRAHPRFSARQYLDLHADLRAAFGIDCTRALQHYLDHGRAEGRIGIQNGYYDQRYTASNDIITIGASHRTAGAIDSVYWNGREMINSFDHGRQLQVALTANGWGECYNPTEAGSGSGDHQKPTSTSVLHAASAGANVLITDSQPAFWVPPGGTAPGCGPARNTTALSPYRFRKTVTVGVFGLRHVIEFRSEVVIPESITSFTYEAPTGYLGGEFTSFYTFNPAGCTLAPLSAGPGEQHLPVVLATPDGAAAMGSWARDLPEPAFPGAGYGRFAFPSSNPANATNKWNMVYRGGATAPGTYAFRTYLAVGTLENVRVSLCQLQTAAP